MFPMSTRAGGEAMAFPDTCNTPTPAGPVPLPYPNTASLAAADPDTCTAKVLVQSQPALTVASQVPASDGDDAGSNGGVVSGCIKGPCRIDGGSGTVILEGSAAAYPSCPTGQNGASANAVGQIVAGSQNKVRVAP